MRCLYTSIRVAVDWPGNVFIADTDNHDSSLEHGANCTPEEKNAGLTSRVVNDYEQFYDMLPIIV